MNPCIGEPISWLRLERYGLGELPADDRAHIDAHLEACPACRACWQTIAGDSQRALPPLAAKVRKLPTRWARLGALAAAAAAIALALRLQGPHPEPPIARRSIKGGELALDLVRISGDGRLLDANGYTPADRFRVDITCPPGGASHAELVVYQDGRAFFPLDPARLECGNHRAMPGAFRIDGTSPALVCIALADGPLDRAGLAAGFESLPELAACLRLTRR
ncbi:MAG TPA: zf-HC2 domain-containing protein [Polyangiales bacterium]|nr:zf-HC2 domain-containing protein [Polyangiales bacterium]